MGWAIALLATLIGMGVYTFKYNFTSTSQQTSTHVVGSVVGGTVDFVKELARNPKPLEIRIDNPFACDLDIKLKSGEKASLKPGEWTIFKAYPCFDQIGGDLGYIKVTYSVPSDFTPPPTEMYYTDGRVEQLN